MQWLALVLKFFPVVFQLIMQIQSAIPHAPGSAKAALITGILQPTAAELPGVTTLITNVVTASQAAGLMAKDSPVVVGANPVATS